MQLPESIVLKFVGGPMDGTYPGGVEYPNNVQLLLCGYLVVAQQVGIGATIQAVSPRGLQDNFRPDHLRTQNLKGGKYVVVSSGEVAGQTVITLEYQGIGGYPS